MTVKAGNRAAGTKGMRREEREQQLLDVGERLFAERGFHAVSMDELAAEAGVTKPMIYAYFGSKVGFYAAGVHRAYERLVDRIEAATAADGEPEEVMWRLTRAIFEWVEQYRAHWSFIYGAQALGGAMAVEAASARAGIVEVVARIIRERMVTDPALESEIEPLAEVGSAVHMALADRWSRHPEESRELQEARAVAMIWPGVSQLIGRER